jgi:hypothetical protein
VSDDIEFEFNTNPNMVLREGTEYINAMGKVAYENDGVCAPMLLMVRPDRFGLIMQMPAGEPIPHFCQLVYILRHVVNPRYIFLNVEAWVKAFPKGVTEEEFPYERGDLEKMREAGDESVRTCIMSTGLDVADWRAFWINSAVEKERPDVEWDDTRTESGDDKELGGSMIDNIRNAWDTAPVPPDEFHAETPRDLQILADTLAGTPMVAGASVAKLATREEAIRDYGYPDPAASN